METCCAPAGVIASFASPLCWLAAGLVQVPASAPEGSGTGRNMTYATMPSATTTAATIPSTRGTLEGRLDCGLPAGAVGGGNWTATVACTGEVSEGAVGAT